MNKLDGMAMGDAVLVSNEDDTRDSSMPSRYILIVLDEVVCLRFVNDGIVFDTRASLTFMADVVAKETTTKRFIAMIYYNTPLRYYPAN